MCLQARKAAALAEKYAPDDADEDARLEKEAKEEERIINQTCDELGVKMHEVRKPYVVLRIDRLLTGFN